MPYRARLTFLLIVLAGVLLWAWRDVRSRRERNAWERSLSVAIVLVRVGPLDGTAVAAFRDRVPALAARLAEERRRYKSGAVAPFVFAFAGPVDMPSGPPKAAGDGLLDAVRDSLSLRRWTWRADGAASLHATEYDSRIYVIARAPASQERAWVEGESEQGGRVGAVEVELDDTMVDFALFVATHELFHTLGATDKYDASGRTIFPDGLAEPDRFPRAPQRFAEVMARNLPLEDGTERPPESLDELAVGPFTAREIGWTR